MVRRYIIIQAVITVIVMAILLYVAGDDLFRQYPHPHWVSDRALSAVHLIGSSLLFLLFALFGLLMLWRGRSWPAFVAFGVWMLLVGATTLFSFMSITMHFAWVIAILRTVSAVFGIFTLLLAPAVVSYALGLIQNSNVATETDRLRAELHKAKHQMQKLMLQNEELEHREKEYEKQRELNKRKEPK